MKPAQITPGGPSDSPHDTPTGYSPARPDAGAPPAPARVRVVRPQFYRSARTGSLAGDVRDALIGIATITDDEGWCLWSVPEIAAWIYPFVSPRRREADLERRAAKLVAADLLRIEACGCAFLPSLKEHHAVKSGRQTSPIWNYHFGHRDRGMPRNSEEPSSSVAVLVADEVEVAASSSSRAPAGEASPLCIDCGRPTWKHAPTCPIALTPSLGRVAAS